MMLQSEESMDPKCRCDEMPEYRICPKCKAESVEDAKKALERARALLKKGG